jgi:type VI secretion system protein VasG
MNIQHYQELYNTRSNSTVRSSIDGAIGYCQNRKYKELKIDHILMKCFEHPGSDFIKICNHFDLREADVAKSFHEAMQKIEATEKSSGLDTRVIELLKNAWVHAELSFHCSKIRSGHLLYSLLKSENISALDSGIQLILEQISTEELLKNFDKICSNSVEESTAQQPGSENQSSTDQLDDSALGKYTTDFTQQARENSNDPVVCRDIEIRKIVQILGRRRQNNPILTGEAGVGKTAIIEGLAQKIVTEEVPDDLKGAILLGLDLGLLQAGASMKGEFEQRLLDVLEEIKAASNPTILFIDEAHTLIGAGGAAGQNDAANLLKPALARGEIKTIAATTWTEYKKYFSKDPALTRRFQVIAVDEPDDEAAMNMLRGISESYQKKHGVRIRPDGIEQAVKLSRRYIPDRHLPDKAVSLIDTACSWVKIAQSTKPSQLQDLENELELIITQIDSYTKHSKGLEDYTDEIDSLVGEKEDLENRSSELAEDWKIESQLVTEILEIRQAEEPSAEDLATLKTKEIELKEIQKDRILVPSHVDGSTVARIVADWTGIPLQTMKTSDVDHILNLQSTLEKSVLGQSPALKEMTKNLQIDRGLRDPRKPTGVFLLCGPSGVGKTETAITLAETLYGGEANMVTLNMSEYQESSKLSQLLGASAGYVGYGEGGVLTEAVRRKPYSLILLDEMEKAHDQIKQFFLGVFDKGNAKDGEGRSIDFKNTLIVVTTNAASQLINQLCQEQGEDLDYEKFTSDVYPELLKTFSPELLGRMVVLPFFPLMDGALKSVVNLQMNKLRKQLTNNYGTSLEVSDEVIDHIVKKCSHSTAGARIIEQLINKTIKPALSIEFMKRRRDEMEISRVVISLEKDGTFSYN